MMPCFVGASSDESSDLGFINGSEKLIPCSLDKFRSHRSFLSTLNSIIISECKKKIVYLL